MRKQAPCPALPATSTEAKLTMISCQITFSLSHLS